ncbi:hypothetical protein [Pseudorhodoplanes sp.]|uniref:hypothetical protein n=1 Tax=Pseudorhodoplanes sp. TaxID=1934341 RepID=UPI002C5CB12F|nr:hypothetical protein [Pseudorhodoplanes sp.]HWV44135.1 hypothetical protein [Pseudorhodoplanes sp.]
MRQRPPQIIAALEARSLVARDFLWIIARDRESGAAVPDGYWSGIGTTVADVVDPETGNVVSRSFDGAAGLIEISAIKRVSNVSVQNFTVTLSQVADRVNELVRTYDCKLAKVQVFRALYDPETGEMIEQAECRAFGFIDDIKITTPPEGEEGSVVLTCTTHTQEMTRANSDTRSDESQKVRSETDAFFADTAVVGDWEMFWGKTNGKIVTQQWTMREIVSKAFGQ